MDNFQLSVTVKNGNQPPLPIIVYLDGPDNYSLRFQKDESFTWKDKLKKGEYRLTINGVNPFEGSTDAEISGTFTEDPIPGLKDSRNSKHYSFHFFFTI